MSDIDPIQYGKLLSKVDELDKEVAEMKGDIKALLELANRSRGGFWAGMAIASFAGGVITFIGNHLWKH